MKIKHIFFTFFNICAVALIAVTGYFSAMVINATKRDPEISNNNKVRQASRIYDDEDLEVRLLGHEDAPKATFSDLPDSFIYALISAEDRHFFVHDGVDVKRLISSAITNISEMSFAQGASTLTQQLIKNEMLSSDKKIERKVNEIVLAIGLEQEYTKEEIFLLYANNIYFDGIKPGVNEAARRFFSKSITEVTIPEAALLAALVKSPTAYNPLRYPEKAGQRQHIILDMMAKYGYISTFTAENAKKIAITDLLNPYYNKITYDYQSYFDLVYREVEEITGLDPHVIPMKIKTHLNTALQQRIDLIQSGKDATIVFNDQLLQIGGAILDNEQGAIIGVIGGRDYVGERIFNHAADLLKAPASTIKPVLSYSLAMEHLNWTDQHVVVDEPYYYKNSDKEVQNVDHVHMGELTLEQAIGYSRNTVALATLEKVIDKIGTSKVSAYLEDINLLDVPQNQFNMAYGIGAFVNGVSPLQMAQAYQVLANGGYFKKATTIKEIELIEGGEKFYPDYQGKQVLSAETAYKVSTVLEGVISKNYWGIGAIKSVNTAVYGKTGTSSFDSNVLTSLDYPSNASKDIWVAGYTGDYTMSMWAGFDKYEKGQNTYFASADSRKAVPRNLFAELLEMLPAKRHIERPESLVKQRIIKGYYPYTIANESIAEQFVTYSYFNKNEALNTELPVPPTIFLQEPSFNLMNNLLTIDFIPLPIEKKNENKIFSFENLYGPIGYYAEIIAPDGSSQHIKSFSPSITYYIFEEGHYQVKLNSGYQSELYRSNEYTYDIYL